jgi:hypothetical protein
MASPRITKVMREGIVANTIVHTFKQQREALEKEHVKLAEKAYKEQYTPSQIKAMDNLGERFIDKECKIHLNLNGLRRQLYFGGKDKTHNTKDLTYKLMENQQYHKPLVPSDGLRQQVEDLLDKISDLDQTIARAEANLLAMLESVQSFKKLRAIWPEGEKFYDMYDVDSEKAGVPAVFVADINKMLGL